MDTGETLHPANVEAAAEFYEETGAEVLRGALCHPSESSGWPLEDSAIQPGEMLVPHPRHGFYTLWPFFAPRHV